MSRFSSFFALFLAGCFLDATGEAGAGGQAAAGGSSNVTNPSGGAQTGGAGGIEGGGGAAGGADGDCGDGKISGTEECEDGNGFGNDGCDGCMNKATCENGEIEPNEECDGGPACDGCETTDDACSNAPDVMVGPNPLPAADLSESLTLPTEQKAYFSEFGRCPGGQTFKPFRFDVGPYPAGLDVRLTGGSSTSALVVVEGCVTPTTESFASNCVADGDPLHTISEVFSPNSIIYVGMNGIDGDSELTIRKHRFFDPFRENPGSNPAGKWTYDAKNDWDYKTLAEGNGRMVSQDDEGTLTTPEIYVGGLTHVRFAWTAEGDEGVGDGTLAMTRVDGTPTTETVNWTAEDSKTFQTQGALKVTFTLTAPEGTSFDHVVVLEGSED